MNIFPVIHSAWVNWKVGIILSSILGVAAATEAFYGQLVVALIAAVPPTGMMIVALISLKRGQIKQQENQAEMAKALDGKLDKLMAAEKGVSKAEGVMEERADERARVNSSSPAQVEIVQPPGNPVPVQETSSPPPPDN